MDTKVQTMEISQEKENGRNIINEITIKIGSSKLV